MPSLWLINLISKFAWDRTKSQEDLSFERAFKDDVAKKKNTTSRVEQRLPCHMSHHFRNTTKRYT